MPPKSTWYIVASYFCSVFHIIVNRPVWSGLRETWTRNPWFLDPSIRVSCDHFLSPLVSSINVVNSLLVGGLNPSEKYVSVVKWDYDIPIYYGKIIQPCPKAPTRWITTPLRVFCFQYSLNGKAGEVIGPIPYHPISASPIFLLVKPPFIMLKYQ